MPTEINDLKTRVTAVESEQIEERKRHVELKEWVLEITAVLKADAAVMKNDIHHIRQTQDKIVSGINRVVYAIILSVIGAFVAFMINGGLAIN